MYGGLFGALPPTKNAKQKQQRPPVAQDSAQDSGSLASRVVGVDLAEPSMAQQQQQQHQPDPTTTTQAGPRNKKESVSSSLVKKLGVTGTSMAFVPTAAQRQRRRPNNNNNNMIKQPQSSLGPATSQSDNVDVKRPKIVADESNSATSFSASFSLVDREPGQHTDEVDQIQADRGGDAVSSVGGEPNVPIVDAYYTNDHVPVSVMASPQQQQQESEELRELHEQAKENMYDPYVPNDLLEYWQGQALAAQREQLERERQQAYEEQDRIQKQLEQERRELERGGDIDKLIEHQTQRSTGRGRGRGVSNLPAWVLEKQKREAASSK